MIGDRIGIEHLSVFGLPPVAFVELVADLGCRYLATGLTPIPYNPHGYEPFSLRDDPELRREMVAAMRDREVSISLGEGLLVREGIDVRSYRADLGVMAELGVPRINTMSLDPELDRALIGYAQLSDAPLAPTVADYMQEATFDRMVPGGGELPLRDILAALPPDVIIGLEVPLRAQAEAGVDTETRLRRCVDAARALLT